MVNTFARVCNHVTDFNARNKCLTANFEKHFLNVIVDYELISKDAFTRGPFGTILVWPCKTGLIPPVILNY